MKHKTTNKVLCLQRWLSILLSCLICVQIYAAEPFKLTGTVRDKQGEPIMGATIMIVGTTNGTTSDIDGNFTMEVKQGKEIKVSYLGYHTMVQPITPGKPLHVVLSEESQVLKDVVVVGYGTMDKKRVTSAITSIKGDNLMSGLGGSTIATALQGKVSGLTISGTSSPNASNGYQLRGVASVNARKGPLVVIDGIPGGDIRAINQEDVESIDVLKDASAGAIYGTRAAAGVILITTKRAKEGKTKVTYSTELSTESVRKSLDLLSSREYIEYGIGMDYGHDTDWYRSLINDKALSQRHVLTLSGGSKTLQLYTSLMYQDQKGIVIGDGRKDYSGRINGRYQMWDGKVELLVKAQVRQTERDKRNDSDIFQQAILLNPTIPLMDPTVPTKYNVNTLGFSGTSWNPVADVQLRDFKGTDKWILGDATLKINFSEHLSLQGTIGIDHRDYQSYSYLKQDHRESIVSNKRGKANHYFSKTINKSFDAYASYLREFKGSHRFDAVAGWSFYENNGESFGMSNANFTVDGIGPWDMSAGTDLKDGDAGMESNKNPRERLLSVFARANYIYDDKYMGSISFRREGSSRFGKNNRWGNFWSVSAGWRISKENFMKEISWIDDLKLRVGYGVTGNNDFGSGYTIRTYKSNDIWPTNGVWQPGYGSTRNINPDLKWEEKREFDLGVDFSFLDNRVHGKFDYYHRNVADMLFEVPAPTPPMVYSNIMKNIGTLSNKGWEAEITGEIIRSKKLSWSSTLRLSHNTSKIKNLGNSQSYLYGSALPQSMGYTSKLVNNSQVGEFWVFKHAGLDANGKWLIYDKDNNVVPAKDGTKNNLVDENKHYVGNGIPKLILAWDNSFTYRNFDLGITMRSLIDYDAFSQINLFHGLKSDAQSNVLRIAYTNNKAINDTRITSDYFISDASFLKIDALTLGYTLDTSKWNKYLNRARVYLTIRDLACFTSFNGYNPEVNVNGLEPSVEFVKSGYSIYPQTIRWTLGVQLTF